jgi:hypothetical protein
LDHEITAMHILDLPHLHTHGHLVVCNALGLTPTLEAGLREMAFSSAQKLLHLRPQAVQGQKYTEMPQISVLCNHCFGALCYFLLLLCILCSTYAE